jgi:uncharacterized protein (UPF0276 family)
MMPEDNFRASIAPLLDEGIVEWVEWTIDMGWSEKGIPAWLEEILTAFSGNERLSGHGVQYSALSAEWTEEQDDWLNNLEFEVGQRKYVHISEHFGFARAGSYLFHAPLPVPYCKEAIESGRANLAKIAKVARCPVGLENLALAFGLHDVEKQGQFLDDLVSEIDGFVVLDLHNLYCQSVNFNLPILQLVRSYPLHRVLEIHVSGGSYSVSKNGYADKPIRRDTHDGPVPSHIFETLPAVLQLCPNVQTVILERLGNSFHSAETESEFASEFRKLKSVLQRFNESDRPNAPSVDQAPATTGNASLKSANASEAPQMGLDDFQGKLVDLLAEEQTAKWVKNSLLKKNAHPTLSNYVHTFEPRMLEVGQELIRKWGVRRKL